MNFKKQKYFYKEMSIKDIKFNMTKDQFQLKALN